MDSSGCLLSLWGEADPDQTGSFTGARSPLPQLLQPGPPATEAAQLQLAAFIS